MSDQDPNASYEPTYPLGGQDGVSVPFDYLPPEVQAQIALDKQGQGANQGPPAADAPLPVGDTGDPNLFQMGSAQQNQLHGALTALPVGAAQTPAAVQQAAAGASTAPVGGADTAEPDQFQNPKDLLFGNAGAPTQAAPPLQGPPLPSGGGGGGGDLARILQQGTQAQKDAALSAAALTGQKSMAEQTIIQSGLDDQGKLAAWQSLHADEMQQYVAQHTAKLESMMADFRNNSKVNPNAYWDNMSTGQRVGSSLALVLSGLGSGLSGQKNMAQEVIERGIKDNIEAQVHNIQTKRAAIDDETNLVAQYMKNGMDISQAKSAALATQKGMVQDRLLANAAGYAGPLAMAHAQQFGGELDMSKAKDLDEFKTHSLQRASEAQAMKFRAIDEGYQIQGRQALYSALNGGQIDTNSPQLAPYVVRLPNGRATIAPRPEDAQKGRDIVSAGSAYDQALGRVQGTTEQAGINPLSSANDARDLAVKEAMAAARTYYHVRDGGDEKEGAEPSGMPSNLLAALAGGGSTVPGFKGKTLERIKSLRADHRADMEAQLRANNVRLPQAPKVTPQGG